MSVSMECMLDRGCCAKTHSTVVLIPYPGLSKCAEESLCDKETVSRSGATGSKRSTGCGNHNTKRPTRDQCVASSEAISCTNKAMVAEGQADSQCGLAAFLCCIEILKQRLICPLGYGCVEGELLTHARSVLHLVPLLLQLKGCML